MSEAEVTDGRALAAVLEEGAAHHRAGRLRDAEQAYRRVLAERPGQPDALHLLGMLAHQAGRHELAVELVRKAIVANPKVHNFHHTLGKVMRTRGMHAEAAAAFRHAATLAPDNAHIHHDLGAALALAGKTDAAVAALRRAIEIDPRLADAYATLGSVLRHRGALGDAEAVFRQAVELDPDNPSVHYNLGTTLLARKRIDGAIGAFARAAELKPDFVEALNNLGLAYKRANKRDAALDAYKRALAVAPKHADVLYNIGNLYHEMKRPDRAAAAYRRAVAARPDFTAALVRLGNAVRAVRALIMWTRPTMHLLDEAIDAYRRALDIAPDTLEAQFQLANALRDKNETEAAIEAYERCLEIKPDYLRARWGALLSLPIFYDSAEQIEHYRARWERGVRALTESLDLGTEAKCETALRALANFTNFYLNYQGHNDLAQQKLYGTLCERIVTAGFPDFAAPPTVRRIGPDERVRVGFISSLLRNHSVYKTHGRWITDLDGDRFETHVFFTGDRADAASRHIESCAHAFRTGFGSIRDIMAAIRDARLDALIFLDIGMDPKMQLIAPLRLAPVQCTTWGHPITSGLSTIDYYLSSDLMEPADGDDHYSEELVRLANLSVSYTAPKLPPGPPLEAETAEAAAGVTYLLSQSLFKLLPQHDGIYARIAERVPDSRFWFIGHSSDVVTEQFRRRLERAFGARGLDAGQYCVIHPRMDFNQFLALNQRADVLLDSLVWSGCNSTFEAVACGLPAVTLPGPMMRGRHTYAILKMMGIEETIARDEDDYVEIAARLGRDRDWRRAVAARVVETRARIFDDPAPVRDLEAFLDRVCRGGE